jgi:hypothetical protein
MKNPTLVGVLVLASMFATKAVPANDVPDIEISTVIVDQLADLSQSHRLLMLGEMHGSRELPALVLATAGRLLDKKQPVVVALEMPERLEPIMTDMLTVDAPEKARSVMLADAFWSRSTQDGRSSQAMLALIDGLRLLRQGGGNIHLLPFDADVTDDMNAKTREDRMAENLRDAMRGHSDARFIVLVGNYHARIQKGAPWDAEQAFVAYQLRDLEPLTLNVTAPTGSVWVCNPDCGNYEFGVGKAPAQPKLDVFGALSDIGYAGEVTLPSLSASPPAQD